jgi:hypothetical protein
MGAFPFLIPLDYFIVFILLRISRKNGKIDW